MSSVPSFLLKKQFKFLFPVSQIFFFHLLTFNLCKNAILIQQKRYFNRHKYTQLYPNQESSDGNVFRFLDTKQNKTKRGEGALLSAKQLCGSGPMTIRKRSPDLYWLQIQAWSPNANNIIFINSAWPGCCPLFFLLRLGTSLVFWETQLNTISLSLCKTALSLSLLLYISCNSQKS